MFLLSEPVLLGHFIAVGLELQDLLHCLRRPQQEDGGTQMSPRHNPGPESLGLVRTFSPIPVVLSGFEGPRVVWSIWVELLWVYNDGIGYICTIVYYVCIQLHIYHLHRCT